MRKQVLGICLLCKKKPLFNVNIAIKVFSRKYSFPRHLFGFPAPNRRNIVIYDENHNDFDFLYIKITYFWLGMLEIIFGLTMITTAIYRSLEMDKQDKRSNNIQPAPSMTFQVCSDPAKMVCSDPFQYRKQEALDHYKPFKLQC